MNTAQYSIPGTHPPGSPLPPTPPRERAFRVALSGVIARRMKQLGLHTVYDIVKRLPDRAAVAPMTVYSAVCGRGRASAHTLYHVAAALDTTTDALCAQALRAIDRGEKLKTVWEVYGEAGVGGRGRKKDGAKKRQR